jgi:hypothetical protein
VFKVDDLFEVPNLKEKKTNSKYLEIMKEEARRA